MSGLLCRSGTYLLIMSSPMKRNAKPIVNSPIDFVRLLLEKSRGIARPISGRAKAEMSTLKPNRAITQAVKVVPTLAPMMTAMD